MPKNVSLIVAMAENRAIGKDGQLPWHLPDDLRRFRSLTLDHPVVMGRKTFDSILARNGRPLPRRRSVVVTRNRGYRAEGAEVVHSLGEAFELLRNEEEVFVIGGAEVFAEALPEADRIDLTKVHAEVEGDVFFPELDTAAWRLVADEPRAADERNEHAFSFRTYERVR